MTIPPQPGASARIAIIVAAFALAEFAFPGGLVAWLEDHDPDGRLAAPIAVAQAIDRASAAVGVKAIGQTLRKRFASVVGADT